MKKIIVLILLILFSLPAFAEYKPIPKDKQAQYKIEVEEYSERIDLTIKSINQKINQQRELFVEATKIKDKSSDKSYYKYVFYKNEWLCLNDNAKVVFSLPYPRYSNIGNFIEKRVSSELNCNTLHNFVPNLKEDVLFGDTLFHLLVI